jgi:uncharacterized protein YacL
MGKKILRVILLLIGVGIGYSLSYLLLRFEAIRPLTSTGYIWYTVVGLLMLVVGSVMFLLAPRLFELMVQMVSFFESTLQRQPLQDLLGGAIGLIIGLIIANLFGAPLSHIPWVGPFIPVIASIFLGYLGWSVGLKKKDDLTGLFSYLKLGGKQGRSDGSKSNYKILDTNVIIDGRIADICKTGFLDGTLIVPRFVLEELQHIADSSDLLRRNKGRRGLDILNQMRREHAGKIEIRDFDDVDKRDVDSSLIQIGKQLNCPVVTNDYNLNKVAELVGVRVLNINDLANAVKPLFLPGEEIEGVDVIRDGKEIGQGIAYLEDGTMIVIENGKRYIGQRINVVVTSVLQTSAGRMIFAKPKTTLRESSSRRRNHEVKVIG